MLAKHFLTTLSPAKVNLGLSILNKLPNGYHEVKTIYSQISLFDELSFILLDTDDVTLKSNSSEIPKDEKNLVIKVAKLIQKQLGVNKGVHIKITKNIPIESGLGGGSSNAAQTILAVNQLWKLNLTQSEMIELAKTIGADVAYQLEGGIKLETQGGKGSGQFENLPNLPKCLIVLCFPGVSISSFLAYEEFDRFKTKEYTTQANNLAPLIEAIKKQNISLIGRGLFNDFETLIFKKYPLLKGIKNQMIEYGAQGALLSGKGSSVFGLFSNKTDAQKTYEKLLKKYPHTYLTTPYEKEEKN